MTLYRATLRDEAVRALREAETLAGPNVFPSRAWPTKAGALPVIQCQVLADTAQSWGRDAPSYTRTAGLLVTAKVAFGTPEQAEALLDTICEQIETAIMLDTALQSKIQQVSAIDTELALDAMGSDQIGVARIRFDLEYPQTFMPVGVPLREINLEIATAAGLHLASAEVDFPQT